MSNPNPLSSYFMSAFPSAFGSGGGSGSGSTPSGASMSPIAPSPPSPSLPAAMPFVAFSPHQCEHDANNVVDFILDRMKINLPEEKIVVPNGKLGLLFERLKTEFLFS